MKGRDGALVDALLDAIGDAVVGVDAQQTIVIFNPAAECMFGYAAAEVVGRHLGLLLPESARLRHNVHVSRLLAVEPPPPTLRMGGRPEIRGRRKDGSEFPAEASISCLERDGTRCFISVVRDLSRLRPDDGVVMARARLLQDSVVGTLEHVPAGILVCDTGGRLQHWNAPLLRLLPDLAGALVAGLHFDDFVERLERGCASVARTSDPPEPLASLPRARMDGRFELGLADGRMVALDRRRTASGGLVEIYRDTTEERRQAASIGAALRAEATMREQLRRFLSIASHEFRTPLAVIDSSAQILLRRAEPGGTGDAADRLRRIRRAVARIIETMEWTLLAERISSQGVRPAPVPVDLAGLLTAAIELHRDTAAGAAIEFVAPAQAVVACVDPKLMSHVVDNLVGNAIKYSPDGPVVRVSLAIEDDRIEIAVADRGIGIPARDVPRLFERYFRAGNTAGIPGTGVGMHLVREIVQLHGGTVSVDSELGKGTTVRLHLPWIRPPGGEALPILDRREGRTP